MPTICSCVDMSSLTRSVRWSFSKPDSCASESCLSSWTASSKQRSLHLFTPLLFTQAHLFIQTFQNSMQCFRKQLCGWGAAATWRIQTVSEETGSESGWRSQLLHSRRSHSPADFSAALQTPASSSDSTVQMCTVFRLSTSTLVYKSRDKTLLLLFFLEQLSSQTCSHMLPPRGRSVIVVIHRFTNLKCTGLQK